MTTKTMRNALFPLVALLVASPASAQMSHGSDASLAGIRGVYQTARGYITAAADQVGEADYGFKPTPEVRSFGQLVGHVANAGYMFCAGALGEQAPSLPDAEKLATKAELVAALKASFEYCDRAYQIDAMKSGEAITFFGQQHTRLSVLAFNMGHALEHYGNMVTYMRLKGMVPPSSQRGM
jgi:uncharacterized damage-inducible protein DinB